MSQDTKGPRGTALLCAGVATYVPVYVPTIKLTDIERIFHALDTVGLYIFNNYTSITEITHAALRFFDATKTYDMTFTPRDQKDKKESLKNTKYSKIPKGSSGKALLSRPHAFGCACALTPDVCGHVSDLTTVVAAARSLDTLCGRGLYSYTLNLGRRRRRATMIVCRSRTESTSTPFPRLLPASDRTI